MASIALPSEWIEEWKNSKVLSERQMQEVLWGLFQYAAGVDWKSDDAAVNIFMTAYKPQVDRIANYKSDIAGPGRKRVIPAMCQGVIAQMRHEGKSARQIADYLNKEFGLNVKTDNIFHSEGWRGQDL